ncbi:uncharacterized protein RSE6_10569 [Rhynchosporium secalis]|uniref:Uncharacterized protein n=1 Tax=Rhynchosporium secalis TaxID=38038 RepID=A0A1E1MKS6_RHYSE|nr:uncharacterized protein RSE6_10569 [Rhynchosporium secalis]
MRYVLFVLIGLSAFTLAEAGGLSAGSSGKMSGIV